MNPILKTKIKHQGAQLHKQKGAPLWMMPQHSKKATQDQDIINLDFLVRNIVVLQLALLENLSDNLLMKIRKLQDLLNMKVTKSSF